MAPYLCLMHDAPGSLTKFIKRTRVNKFSKIAVPLRHVEQSLEHDSDEESNRTGTQLVLTHDDWHRRIMLILPDYDCDAADEQVRKNAETTLMNDLSYGEHLVKTGTMLVRLKSADNTNLARIIAKQSRSKFLVQVPLYSTKRLKAKTKKKVTFATDDGNVDDGADDAWHWWHNFRSLNNYRKNVKVVLELNQYEIPSSANIFRWLSEPLEAIIVPSSLFIYDDQDNPQLTRAWHKAMIFFMRACVNVFVTADDDECWMEFADYFYEFQTHYAGNDVFEIAYDQKDELTVPLQTVHTNVNFMLYEEFETDNTKYIIYMDALVDAFTHLGPGIIENSDVIVLTVLGAGRGPLIECILTAAQRTSYRVRIYVIEKNVNAVHTLKYLVAKYMNNDDIHVFCKDMREFTPPEKADILVSELLGSFGDNELSPECLDCAAKFMKPNGISIPSSSTSFLNPIMAPTYRDKIAEIMQTEYFDYIDFESTFVTIMRNAYHISPSQKLFTFKHPNLSPQTDNTRYKVLKFKAESDCVMNGLAGGFEAVLYRGHKLSIHRLEFTRDLISWFPMFFPFIEPINIKKDDEIEIHFWRCVDAYKVWYEWCCVSPQSTHIHNYKGRSSPIYLE